MVVDIDKDVIEAIRRLYRADSAAQALFDWTASRTRDATATSLDRLSNKLNLTRGDAVALARSLEKAGCGQFVVGRRGQPSRFEWKYSCISLGQAAAGEDVKLEAAEDPLPEIEEEQLEAAEAASGLTLAQAKIALSKTLGVPVENIEITIRA